MQLCYSNTGSDVLLSQILKGQGQSGIPHFQTRREVQWGEVQVGRSNNLLWKFYISWPDAHAKVLSGAQASEGS